MALLARHQDQVASAAHEFVIPLAPAPYESVPPPVVVGDWWCHECGRPEADERTRLCPECGYRTASRATATWKLTAVVAANVVPTAVTLAALVLLRRRVRQGGSR